MAEQTASLDFQLCFSLRKTFHSIGWELDKSVLSGKVFWCRNEMSLPHWKMNQQSSWVVTLTLVLVPSNFWTPCLDSWQIGGAAPAPCAVALGGRWGLRWQLSTAAASGPSLDTAAAGDRDEHLPSRVWVFQPRPVFPMQRDGHDWATHRCPVSLAQQKFHRSLQFLTLATCNTLFLWCSVLYRHTVLQIKHQGIAFATRQTTGNVTLQICANEVYWSFHGREWETFKPLSGEVLVWIWVLPYESRSVGISRANVPSLWSFGRNLGGFEVLLIFRRTSAANGLYSTPRAVRLRCCCPEPSQSL